MYKVVVDMVYRYTVSESGIGTQLVGILLPGESVEEFVAKNKAAFL